MSYCIEGAILCAFDLLWLNGEDLWALPLHERKRRLRKVIPRSKRSRLRFSNHIEATGCEVVVVQNKTTRLTLQTLITDARWSPWIKIKNPRYTQVEGRHELFDQMRG